MNQFPNLSGPAGAAFLLHAAPKEGIIFEHPFGRVCLRVSARYVSVELNSKPADDDIRSVAWQVVQESLDVLAAKGRASHVTSNGDTEYLFWEEKDGVYELTCVCTAESSWSIQAHATIGGRTSPPPPPPFFHHESLRYYRMSKCTSDLFDAYRNAYMGFECLISSESPKKASESELNWLKRVVNGPLRGGVPVGIDINPLLYKVYKNGRLPLFHAKIGQTFHAPHGDTREEIQELFEELTLLLIALLQYKFGSHAIRGWPQFSQEVEDSQTRVNYEFDELQFPVGDDFVSVRPEIKIIDAPRRFGQLWAKVRVERPTSLNSLRHVRFPIEGNDWVKLEIEEDIPLVGVRGINFEINSSNRNVHQPRQSHSE